MNTSPFHRPGPGRFYRGNLHTHSNKSDGGTSPRQVVAAYREQGYDFVALTDHFLPEFNYPVTDTSPWRSDDFTTLIGAELHAPALANGSDWHIVAVGLPVDFGPPRAGETGAMLAERAREAGAFVGLAHPAWYGASVEDLLSISAAHAVEVYNDVCGTLSDRPESWFHADALLAAGRRISVYGADDAHFRDHFESEPAAIETDVTELGDTSTDGREADAGLPEAEAANLGGFACWVWVRAERLDPVLLVESLKSGQFYTSQGPLIHDIEINDARDELTVVNSPAVSVLVTGRPDVFTPSARHARHITRSTFSIAPFRNAYCRVTVVDADGKRAWSNPIWLD